MQPDLVNPTLSQGMDMALMVLLCGPYLCTLVEFRARC